jgi:ABC-type spermidine/putrescine transport system permease subunit II
MGAPDFTVPMEVVMPALRSEIISALAPPQEKKTL